MNSTKILSVFWHNIDNSLISRDGANPTVAGFRRHVEFLVTNYTPISIVEFLEILRQRRFIQSYKRPPILLGFDDGFKNVLRYGLPVLAEFNAPAVFFVLGETIRNRDFVPWYVERKHLIRKAVRKVLVYGNRRIDLDIPGSGVQLMRLFDAFFKSCGTETERQTLMTDFAEVLGVDRPRRAELDEDLQFIDAMDLTSLSTTSLLTVASHAMSHRALATLSQQEQLAELEQSNFLLSQQCQCYYPVVAYPNGSFNEETISIAARIYKAGFAVLLGASYRNLFAYPRISLRDNSIQELSYLISAKRRRFFLPIKRVLHLTGVRPLEE